VNVRRVYHVGCGQHIGWTTAIEEPPCSKFDWLCCMCSLRLFTGHLFFTPQG
jgi:hypothetical protein